MQKTKHSCGGLARERMHVSDHSWIVTDVFGLQRVNELEEFFGDMGQGYTVGLAFRSRLFQIMCKPPEWCRIEASHRRLYI